MSSNVLNTYKEQFNFGAMARILFMNKLGNEQNKFL